MGCSSDELKEFQANQYRAMSNVNSPPVPRPTIPQVLDEQQKEVARLEEALENLAGRLALVLEPEMVNTGGRGKDVGPQASTVIDRVRDHNRWIAGARSRIEELLGRLQL